MQNNLIELAYVCQGKPILLGNEDKTNTLPNTYDDISLFA